MADSPERFDLVVVGTGSGNSVLTPDFDDWRVALIERDAFGGTCLNRGCIPSKMFVYAADMAHQSGHTSHLGVDSSLDGVRWPEIVGRVFGRIDPIAQGGEDYRHSLDNVTVFNGDARFVGHKVLEVNGHQLTGDHIVLAAGARPFIPPIPGLADVAYHTSDTIMRLEVLPERLVILGGGYIAAELGHVFDAMGVSVSIVNRSERLLRAEDEDVSAAFTEIVSPAYGLRFGLPHRRGLAGGIADRGSYRRSRCDRRCAVAGHRAGAQRRAIGRDPLRGGVRRSRLCGDRRVSPHRCRRGVGAGRHLPCGPAQAHCQRGHPGSGPTTSPTPTTCWRLITPAFPTRCSPIRKWPR